MSIGSNILNKRQEKRMTQEKLAECLGVTRQAVSDWERDANKPEIQNLIDLAKLFEVSINWLCGVESAGSETICEKLTEKGEKRPESKSDGRTLKIIPALLDFGRITRDVCDGIYSSEDKEDGQ